MPTFIFYYYVFAVFNGMLVNVLSHVFISGSSGEEQKWAELLWPYWCTSLSASAQKTKY